MAPFKGSKKKKKTKHEMDAAAFARIMEAASDKLGAKIDEAERRRQLGFREGYEQKVAEGPLLPPTGDRLLQIAGEVYDESRGGNGGGSGGGGGGSTDPGGYSHTPGESNYGDETVSDYTFNFDDLQDTLDPSADPIKRTQALRQGERKKSQWGVPMEIRSKLVQERLRQQEQGRWGPKGWETGTIERAQAQQKKERIGQAATLREADRKAWSARFEFITTEYSELGKKIRDAPNSTQKLQLIQKRNDLIDEGKDLAAPDKLNKQDIQEGKFPYVEHVTTGDIIKEGAKSATEDLDALQSTMGTGMGALGLKRGQVFRGTSYQSTGAINGVMKALAGIFILFVFIGVFYMVFGPIYDSLIFNFTNIVSADGDPTLGGKDIPTLFDNVAKVILVWVPLLVFAGALYKLTALVFEREVGTRTTEETEWDMLGAIEDSTDLDAGSDPGVFEAYGGGY